MTDVANAVDGENASAPAAPKAAPKDPWALPDDEHRRQIELARGRGLSKVAPITPGS